MPDVVAYFLAALGGVVVALLGLMVLAWVIDSTD